MEIGHKYNLLPQLQFINPVGFEDWTPENSFSTVRFGGKWDSILDEFTDPLVEVWFCEDSHHGRCDGAKGCTYKGPVQVDEVWKGQLRNMPARILDYEHNPKCRTISGLYERLNEIYSPTFQSNVHKTSTVTGIVFTPRS